MKVLLSIPLLILISFSGISVKLATHYCGGDFVVVKISLSGQQATCGMEPAEDDNSSNIIIKPFCCENIASEYTISNIFIPSATLVDLPGQKIFGLSYFPADLLPKNEFSANHPFTDIGPPRTNFSKTGILQVLCTLRI